jgi:lipopolysaccharide transport system ATP-binding protein
MTEPVIRVEHLSKRYRIGHTPGERHTTLRDVITRKVKSLWQRVPRDSARVQAVEEDFWALKGVSFEIQPGDRLGIIGRNGAGKTTLLKILSRITAPTEGRVRIRGRVASLLEVGTGFHPELTGRENIFLNGTILGMKKAEISRKFDEIVGFAEVEKFLDTPVKRYSSGMYVRLAFAVAAHLDPDILVIDEVLAVGDAKFQKKCLGKMREVTGEGRTLLFVTHQMGMVAQLCSKALILEQGSLTRIGDTEPVIASYLKGLSETPNQRFVRPLSKITGKRMYVAEVTTRDTGLQESFEFGHKDPIAIELQCVVNEYRSDVCLGFAIKDRLGRKVFTSQIELDHHGLVSGVRRVVAQAVIPAEFLTPGEYFVTAALHVANVEVLDEVEEICRFTIRDTGSDLAMYEGADYGCVFARCQWEARMQT